MTRTVAIVGRPNVGKSTLFNRLVGQRIALVDDRPGVTRDRREGEARLGHLSFRVIDTAGLEDAEAETLEARMRAQTETAIAEADVTLFVVDSRSGVTPEDQHFAALLRKASKPVILVANKSEGKAGLDGAYDAYRLGLGDPVAISAEHGEGMGSLIEALEDALPPERPEGEDDEDEGEGEAAVDPAKPIKVAIVGRPNAGKSTLVNRLLGEERMLTGPEAGITRDAIASDWHWQGRVFELFDTAGMRKKARVQDKLEKLSVGDALRAIRFAEVVVVLVDVEQALEKQDLQIADLVSREGRAVVIALSKWDLVDDGGARFKALREEIDRLLPQIRGVPVVALSGLTGQGGERLPKAILEAYEVWNRRVSTGRLNRWFEAAMSANPPPAVQGRRIKLRYATQAKARPPSFVIFGTRTDALPESYVRYLVNGLRETFGLVGVPVRLTFREPENPYDPS